jgi:hypothetical protein
MQQLLHRFRRNVLTTVLGLAFISGAAYAWYAHNEPLSLCALIALAGYIIAVGKDEWLFDILKLHNPFNR